MGMKRKPSARPIASGSRAHFSGGGDENRRTACGLLLTGSGEQVAATHELLPAADYAVNVWDDVDCHGCRETMPLKICHVQHMNKNRTVCQAKNVHQASRWTLVTCADCHSFAHAPSLMHRQTLNPKGKPVAGCTGKAWMTSPDPARVECLECRRWSKVPAVPRVLEELAQIAVANAIVAARKSGFTFRVGACQKCGDTGGHHNMCIPCALPWHLGKSPDPILMPDELSALLGLPHEWAVDFIAGADSEDGHDAAHRSAFDIGRELRRKYGE